MKREAVEALPYRPCVGIMLIDRRGLIFVAKRIDTTTEAWQMPQGGIDKGESPRDAALRELEEETGVRTIEPLGESRDWYRYDLPKDLVGKVWKGRYRGQEQKWFAFRFLGEEAEIDINRHEPEFEAWRWVEIERLPDLIVPFKRQVYADLVTEFRPLAPPHKG